MDEQSLRIYWYNTMTGKYEIVPGQQLIQDSKIKVSVMHFSTYRIVGTYLTTSLSNVIGYPSPFRPNNAVGGKFKVINMPTDCSMDIYTISGEKVRSLREVDMAFPNSGWIDWDGKNESGDTVAQGVYIYLVKSTDGSKKVGKIGIVK